MRMSDRFSIHQLKVEQRCSKRRERHRQRLQPDTSTKRHEQRVMTIDRYASELQRNLGGTPHEDCKSKYLTVTSVGELPAPFDRAGPTRLLDGSHLHGNKPTDRDQKTRGDQKDESKCNANRRDDGCGDYIDKHPDSS